MKRSRIEAMLDKPMGAVWESVHKRCRHRLASYRSIDPEDAAQETMVQVLRLDYLDGYDPRRGTVWGYVLGTADKVCFGMIRQWRRLLRESSPLEVVGEIATAKDPIERAILREILDDLRDASAQLTPKQYEALPDVLGDSSGPRRASHERGRPNYSATCRCRMRLRVLMVRHAPQRLGPAKRALARTRRKPS